MVDAAGSLAKITRGAGIAFAGSAAGMLVAFLGRVIVARLGTEADYGVFSLAFAVLSMCAVLATVGLQEGAPRSIAYARGKGDSETARKVLSLSVLFGLLASGTLCILVLCLSGPLAAGLLHDASLAFPLRVSALCIPFFAMILVLASLFRGFDDVTPTVYFQSIMRNGTFTVLLLPVLLLRLPFENAFYALLASLAITCVSLGVYAAKRLPLRLWVRPSLLADPVARELLLFSAPLLTVVALQLALEWTDTLMLGALRDAVDVGLYNAARPLAAFISAPLAAMSLIYVPVSAGLFVRRSIGELHTNFLILTKWLCSATLPVLLILLFFPVTVLGLLFGAEYAGAAGALRILAVAFMINNLFGPNAATLVAMGEVRFMMWATLAAAGLNIGLNAALIPPFGMDGAAIASVVAITAVNVARCWKLHSLTGLRPLSRNLLKPLVAFVPIVCLIYFTVSKLVAVAFWMLPLLLILGYGILFGSALLTRSFDEQDVAVLRAMEEKTGVKLEFARRVLRSLLKG